MENIFGDAFSCPAATHIILQETRVVFSCPKCQWNKEYAPNAVNDYSHLRMEECFDCEYKSKLKQYEIVDGKCHEVKTKLDEDTKAYLKSELVKLLQKCDEKEDDEPSVNDK